MPFFLEAAILSRIRSPATSRSNWANESSTFRVSRPIEVVVLNCWVIETKETPSSVEGFHDLGEIEQRSREPVDFVDHHHVDLAGTNVGQESLQGRAVHRPA